MIAAADPEAAAVSAAVARVKARARKRGIGAHIAVSDLPSRFNVESSASEAEDEDEATLALVDVRGLRAATFAQYVDGRISALVAATAGEAPQSVIRRVWRVDEVRAQQSAAADDANGAPIPPPQTLREDDLPEVVAAEQLQQSAEQQPQFPPLRSLAFARELRSRLRAAEGAAKAKAKAATAAADDAAAAAEGSGGDERAPRRRRRGFSAKPAAKHRMRVDMGDGTVYRLRKAPTHADIALEPPSKSIVSPKFLRQPALALQQAAEEDAAASADAAADAAAVAPIAADEVVLRVSFFSKKGTHDQDWFVLGSQRLTELRDEFSCLRDELARSHAAMAHTRELRSASFLIENVFYNDMRCPENVDLSAPIIAWADRKRAEMPAAVSSDATAATPAAASTMLGPYEVKDMAATTFAQLRIRIGAPYAFLHQGDCEHRIVFTDMRLFSRGEDDPDRRSYPRLVAQSRVCRKKCTICNLFAATLVTYGDERAPASPAFWCQRCFDEFHLAADGSPLYGGFTKLPYIHELK